jgi:signal transduction histidine kinase
MSEMKLTIRKLIYKIIVIYFSFLFLSLGSVFFIQLQFKKQITESSIKLIRENIMNDNQREVAKSLTQVMDQFTRIEYLNFDKNRLLVLPEVNSSENYFNIKLLEKIFLDSNKQIVLGTFSFEYSPWGYIGITFLSWMLLSISAFPWFISSKKQIAEFYKERLTLDKAKIMTDIAKQVSHDIRSPLSALNLIVGSLSHVPEEKRVIIRSSVNRITDIANQLLHSNNVKERNSADNKYIKSNKEVETLSVELLPAIIDVLVSEKRYQFREKSNISIETDFVESYGAFAKINPTEFKRTISNTVNNAVEALKRDDGQIIISVKNFSKKTLVSVRDNGSGIPPHILLKLGQMGVTHGKEATDSGSGLGVYYAKKTIESFGAKFEIISQEGRGTEIRMEFPKCEIPNWFVPTLKLNPNHTILALDDDFSVLEIWKQRIRELHQPSIKLITLSTDSDFQNWVTNNKEMVGSTLFLMDFEFIGQKNTGLDLIEKANLKDNAILVTSRYEEPSIRKRCADLGVRQIPKGMAPFVPIEIQKEHTIVDAILLDDDRTLVGRSIITQNSTPAITTEVKTRYDLCLLDDDNLIHSVWAMVARFKGLNIKMFSTPTEFQSIADAIDRETPIYIDVSLGNGISGVDFSEKVHKMGFLNINLATGYAADSLAVPPYVCNVVGKDFPENI